MTTLVFMTNMDHIILAFIKRGLVSCIDLLAEEAFLFEMITRSGRSQADVYASINQVFKTDPKVHLFAEV